jgi:hypothetical protein
MKSAFYFFTKERVSWGKFLKFQLQNFKSNQYAGERKKKSLKRIELK